MQVEGSDDFLPKEVSKGTLDLKVTFLPAGKLFVLVDKALGLQYPSEYHVTSSDLNRLALSLFHRILLFDPGCELDSMLTLP